MEQLHTPAEDDRDPIRLMHDLDLTADSVAPGPELPPVTTGNEYVERMNDADQGILTDGTGTVETPPSFQ